MNSVIERFLDCFDVVKKAFLRCQMEFYTFTSVKNSVDRWGRSSDQVTVLKRMFNV